MNLSQQNPGRYGGLQKVDSPLMNPLMLLEGDSQEETFRIKPDLISQNGFGNIESKSDLVKIEKSAEEDTSHKKRTAIKINDMSPVKPEVSMPLNFSPAAKTPTNKSTI